MLFLSNKVSKLDNLIIKANVLKVYNRIKAVYLQ